MTSRDRLLAAFERIERWMRDHEAPLLVDNLAEGATDAAIDAAQAAIGCAVPQGLRDLWALHNGQREELNGFVEHRDLFDIERSLAERETAIAAIGWLRTRAVDWEEAGVTRAEIESDAWLPFVGRDSDLIIVSCVSGRVFRCEKDSPPLHLEAASIVEWAEAYAARVTADAYAVEEGFGDYYLERRDLEREQREAERQRKLDEDAKYQRETPLLAQCREAMTKGNSERCRDLFRDLVEKGDPLLSDGLALLFTSTNPALVATALQFVLRKVTLTKDQWAVVARGGQLLGNNAIHSFAESRAR